MFETAVERITNIHELYSNKIFIFKLEPSNELVISYNIVPHPNISFISNTILVHRKKETNTMYTINALNNLIITNNGGRLNKNYRVDWDEFKNSIILTNGEGYKVLKTNLYRIINSN